MSGGRVIALLHPGAMGVTVGTSLIASGHRVRWYTSGRSAATRRRAEAAGCEPQDSLEALLDAADGVISVCPPAAAPQTAAEVAGSGFSGCYVEANAVSPDTVRALQTTLGDALVDAGIVGPPALRPGTTRLYLSGPRSAAVAAWFSAGALEAVALPGPVGAASALKMCYAAYTKGTSALLLAVRALAEAEGVTPALLAEWEISQPGLAKRSQAAAGATAPKAWRFVGEMEEIAATFEAAGLPSEFHRGAAEVYRRLEAFKDSEGAPLADVLERLLRHTR